MCDTCGCNDNKKEVKLLESIFKGNLKLANHNKEHINKLKALSVNLISSPGAGKTTLLENTIELLKDKLKIAVLEGDIETQRDAERIRAKGIPAIQLTTGGACHLEAELVHKGLSALEKLIKDFSWPTKNPLYPEDPLDLLFIENVGNLVCPASFYLGEDMRVVLTSVPEGPDKPAKYPKAFKTADVFIITKIDLLPYFKDFDLQKIKEEALSLNPNLEIFTISNETKEGFDQWIDYLMKKLAEKKSYLKNSKN
ncbi:MAG TPA: hydrogenase accessory protein HypB [Desulfurobacteriaceae bacterium]|nr:hydrogenase accessory protein HypB [Desulfurobacteriaceae bacterium]